MLAGASHLQPLIPLLPCIKKIDWTHLDVDFRLNGWHHDPFPGSTRYGFSNLIFDGIE
jgi:hypothetical protein